MEIVSWNVNSVRARLERLLNLLERHQPDVVCLQELKCTEDKFPFDVVRKAGYNAVVHGQPSYNGVAILSREELVMQCKGMDDGQARFICADTYGLRIVSAYIPNGSSPASPKYAYKLQWLDDFAKLASQLREGHGHIVLAGDYNIAPQDQDVANPEQWADTVLCHEAVRQRFDALLANGWVDAYRVCEPEGGHYTWWDYRMLGFPKNNGLRIDHLLVSRELRDRLTGARVDRDERKGRLPSDHAPVFIGID